MVSNTTDKQGAIDLLEKAIEVIGDIISKEEGGSLNVKMKPKAVSETDDLELAALMDRVARENKEVSGASFFRGVRSDGVLIRGACFSQETRIPRERHKRAGLELIHAPQCTVAKLCLVVPATFLCFGALLAASRPRLLLAPPASSSGSQRLLVFAPSQGAQVPPRFLQASRAQVRGEPQTELYLVLSRGVVALGSPASKRMDRAGHSR